MDKQEFKELCYQRFPRMFLLQNDSPKESVLTIDVDVENEIYQKYCLIMLECFDENCAHIPSSFFPLIRGIYEGFNDFFVDFVNPDYLLMGIELALRHIANQERKELGLLDPGILN